MFKLRIPSWAATVHLLLLQFQRRPYKGVRRWYQWPVLGFEGRGQTNRAAAAGGARSSEVHVKVSHEPLVRSARPPGTARRVRSASRRSREYLKKLAGVTAIELCVRVNEALRGFT